MKIWCNRTRKPPPDRFPHRLASISQRRARQTAGLAIAELLGGGTSEVPRECDGDCNQLRGTTRHDRHLQPSRLSLRPLLHRLRPLLAAILMLMATVGTVSSQASPSPTSSPYVPNAIVSSNTADHTCFLSSTGGLACFGLNNYGQLGNGGTASLLTPSPVYVLTNVSSVSLGSGHTCALMAWGGLRCWGWNYAGQLGNSSNPPPSALYSPSTSDLLTSVAAVSSGANHTCALMSWGGVRCWGSNTFGQLCNGDATGANVYVPPATDSLTNVSSIASGYSHVCALLVWGGVRCWGNNTFGQLGTGTTVSMSSPVGVDALASVAAITAGGWHTCALLTWGGLRCWGSNANGQLGIGTALITQLYSPPTVDALASVSAVTAGGSHTCALMTWGGVRCWGYGISGQLGNGGTSTVFSPPSFDTLTGVNSITAGSSHTCAVLSDGGYRCWGYNGYGECGNGASTNVLAVPAVDASPSPSGSVSSTPSITPPVTLTMSTSPTSTQSTSFTSSVSPTTSLTVSTSVSPSVSPSLGSSVSVSPSASPSGLFVMIASSEAANHTCAVMSGGVLTCWGANAYGQLGSGGTVQMNSTLSSPVLTNVASVSVGSSYSCALMAWGGVRCWGNNTYGQLNNASAASLLLSPSAVDAVSNVTSLSCGYYHTCVVFVWGNASCWGGNMVLPSSFSSNLVSVSSGGDHSCALSAAGGVRCWGWNGYGQLGTGTTAFNVTFPSVDVVTGVSAVATGYAHTCVLLASGGGVVCWGANPFGQLGNGDVTGMNVLTPPSYVVFTTAIGVYAGYGHTCVLTAWGGVRCWGLNANGQLGNGGAVTLYSPPVSDFLLGAASVATGYSHTCARMVDGGVRCWGSNSNGQLGNGLTSSVLAPPSIDTSPSVSVTISVSTIASTSSSPTVTSSASATASASYLSASPSLSKTTSCSITPTLSTSIGSSATASAAPSPSGQYAAIVSSEAASYTCAITSYGGLRCFGGNLYGQLGTGGTTRLYSPPVADTLQSVSAVTTGQYHTCVLMTWGGVKCWGSNSNGQLGLGNASVPIGSTLTSPSGTDTLPFVAAVTAGQGHTCVLMSWGGVRCWGSNNNGQCGNGDSSGANVVSPPNSDVIVNVSAISCGQYHTCVLMVWGGVRCWGANTNGQLGNGGTTNVLSPPSSDVIANVSAIALGGSHTCVLMISGGVRCWGYNTYGQSGNGGTTQMNSPPVADVITAAIAVSAGTQHTCALMAWGGVRCWGYNAQGQLGNGSTTQLNSPPVSDVLSGVASITAGSFHTCALMMDGGFRCWGSNSVGQLGNGTTTAGQLNSPPSFDTSPSVSSTISVSVTISLTPSATPSYSPTVSHSASVTSSASSSVSISSSLGCSPSFTPLPSPSGQYAAIVTSQAANHTCAITSYGGLRCWGANLYGQLGSGGTTQLNSVSTADVLTNVSAVSVGSAHTCALMTWGGVRCWGYNVDGELGNGGYVNILTPPTVDTFMIAASVAVGANHTCALSWSGGVRCWGLGTAGQLGNSGVSSASRVPNADAVVGVAALAAGANHTCLLMISGGVRCWGLNAAGQLGNGATTSVFSIPLVDIVSFVRSITAGASHTCVLMTWGGVRCWGNNSFGQLGNGDVTGVNVLLPPTLDSLSNVTVVSAGYGHTCAVMVWTGVRCWGLNANGQLGNNGTTTLYVPPASDVLFGVASVTAGYAHTCVLMADGGFRCWGASSSGQLGNGAISNAMLTPPLLDTSPSISITISVTPSASNTQSSSVSSSPTGSLTFTSSLTPTQSASPGASVSVSPSQSPSGQYVAVMSGEDAQHTCAITSYGGVRCWGYNANGQLGNGDVNGNSVYSPPNVDVLTSVSAIAVGGYHTCARMTWAGVRCWGQGTNGQLGYGGIANVLSPPASDVIVNVSSVTAGQTHTCVLMIWGGVRCWGGNGYGQCGNGGTASSPAPPSFDVIVNVTSLSAGLGHTCVLMVWGGVRCWGYGLNGQLGNGGTTNVLSPPSIDILTSVSAIAAGGYHTCVVMTWGGVRCWGDNNYGEVGVGSYALNGQVNSPLPNDVLTSATAVVCGLYHTCALMLWGGVRCWGYSFHGELGNGGQTQVTSPPVVDVLTGVAAISAGEYHTCALMMDGGFRCWGNNQFGQLGNGSTSGQVNSPPSFDSSFSVSPSVAVTSSPTPFPSPSLQSPTPTVSSFPSASLTPVVSPSVSLGATPTISPSPSPSGQYVAIVCNNFAFHVCAITSYGGVRCWGLGSNGQLGNGGTAIVRSPPVTDVLTAVSAVALGSTHTCALMIWGGVRCWGYNNYGQLGNGSSGGQLNTPSSWDVISGVSAVSCGSSHTCVLRSSGGVRCWGLNTNGQLGNGSTSGQLNSPLIVDVIVNVSAISCGQYHTCVLMAWGGVRCWGYGIYGQLGNGSTQNVLSPPSSDVIANVSAIALGGSHTCVLMIWGGVRCWGYNAYGQLGNGGTTQMNSPPVADVITAVIAVSAGYYHSCALMAWGGVRCWGSNQYGQLGNSVGTGQLNSPPGTDVLTGVAAISAGEYHTCALMMDGGFRCWGYNQDGQLGNGSIGVGQLNSPPSIDTSPSTSISPSATPAPSLSGSVSMSMSVAQASGASFSVSPSPSPSGQYAEIVTSEAANHTCAITSYGGLRCWGGNAFGQLGNGDASGSSVLRISVVDVLTSVRSVAVGAGHTCVVTVAGGVRCWGYGAFGQLGSGSTLQTLVPPATDVLTSAASITAGWYHTCVVMTWGGARCWGSNVYGQLGNGGNTNVTSPPSVDVMSNVSAITAGYAHTCTLMQSGGVRCWGYSSFGQLGTGLPGSILYSPPAYDLLLNVSAISAGSYHTCALMVWGGVRCWGSNTNFQLGNGDGTGSQVNSVPVIDALPYVSSISTGSVHSCAVMNWGGVRCWGSNSVGQLGTGAGNVGIFIIGYPPADVLSSAVSVTCGQSHTCALMSDGGVQCWGGNANGQLGNGGATQLSPPSVDASPSMTGSPSSTPSFSASASVTQSLTLSITLSPSPLPSVGSSLTATPSTSPSSQYAAIMTSSSSALHTCALTSYGGMRCWGYNTFGQLGNGNTLQVNSTPIVDVFTGVATVALGYGHTCALTALGGARCWGWGMYGQLGSGASSTVSYPPSVDALVNVSSISVGGLHSCAVMSWGGARCWGANAFGQLGNGGTSIVYSPPSTDVLRNVSNVVAGYSHTCAVMTWGGVRCWGSNSFGQLGNGDSSGASVLSPPTVDILANVSAVSAGQYHTCALMTWSGVRCWGYNADGELGNGFTNTVYSPPSGDVLSSVKSVSAGGLHTCVVMTWGGVKCWGNNWNGQLGTGNTQGLLSPLVSDVLLGVSTVTTGQYHTCALTSVGGVRCWGSDTNGQLGDGGAPAAVFFPPSFDLSPSISITSSISVTVSFTATTSTTASTTGSVSGTASTTASVSGTASTTASVSITTTTTASVSITTTTTASVSGTTTATTSASSTQTLTASASGTNTLTATVSATLTVSPSVSVTTTVTVTVSATVSSTATVTATVSATSSLLCPLGCLQCIAYNCTLCDAGLRLSPLFGGNNMFGCVALVSIPPFTCTVPDTAAVGDVLSCPNSGLLAFSPELFALRLDTLTLDGAGVLHPFVQVTVNDSSAFEIVVGPELNSPVSSSLTFNFIQLPVYVIYVSLCEPQALAAFPSVGGPMDFIACSTTQSVIERFQITVTLIHVDLPPVFTLPSFNISVSGVGTAGVSVWQPLSHFVTNPDPVYPYNVTRYRLVPGQCGRDAISAQDVAAPVSIGTGNGSMYYTVSGGLGNYPSPMSLCVLVIDGGGLFAAADISLWFTSVQQQLSVLSPSVNVTHYSPGVTVVTVGVAYNPGSLVNGNWTVTVPTSGWCNVTYGDSHTIVIQLNSLTLMSASQPSFTVNAVVSTADRALVVNFPITVQLAFAFASLSSNSIHQLIRPASTASTTITLFNSGPGALVYNIPTDSRNVSVLIDGLGTIVWGVVEQPYSGVILPNSFTVLSFQTISGTLPAAGYSSSISIQTTQPLPSSSGIVNPTAPVSLSSGAPMTISWGINILQALVFPPQQSLSLSPNQTAIVLSFAVANFAGSPVQVSPQNGTLPDWMTLSLESDVVQNGNMVGFNITVQYPTVPSSSRRLNSVCDIITLPDSVGPDSFINISMALNAWRLPPGITPETLPSVDNSVKIPLPLQNISILATTVLGIPSARYSCAVPLDVTNCTVGNTVVILVVVRDAGGSLIPFSASSGSMISTSVTCFPSESCTQIISGAGLADVVNVYNTTDEGVYSVEVQALATGPLLLQMSINQESVGSPIPLLVFGIVCPPHQLTLDGIRCVCAAGYYFTSTVNGTTCEPCRAGTHSRNPGSVGSSSCIPCPAGSYCLPASVNATGECPPGFDCSSGIIAVPIGFWSPAVNISAASNVGNASIYPCFTRTACQGGNASVGAVCAAGYVGPLCATCASGWAGHAGVCQHCLPRGVLAFGLTAVGLLLSCTLGLAVAIILQSDSPSDPLTVRLLFEVKREALFARLRVLFDTLQVVGLLLSLSSSDRSWFAGGVLSVAGASIGLGLGVTTWSPWLCLLPTDDFPAVVWVQVGIMVSLIPIAMLAAAYSQPLARAVWKRRTTPRSFKDRFKVSLSILAYLSFVGLLHTATLGSISRKDPLTGRLVMLANWREPIGTIGPFSALWVCRSAVGMCGLLVVVVMGWIAYSVKKDRPLTPALHALTLGYKLPRLEFLFEFLFLLRKWGLMIAGLAFVDSFWTLLVAVANYCVLWAAAIRVKPFATQSGQFHFRTAQGLTLLMMLILLLRLTGSIAEAGLSALEALWMILFFSFLLTDAYFVAVGVRELLRPKLGRHRGMVRFTSWKPQGVVLSNPAAFARSSRVKKAKTRGDSVIGDPEWRISPLEMADKAAEHK